MYLKQNFIIPDGLYFRKDDIYINNKAIQMNNIFIHKMYNIKKYILKKMLIKVHFVKNNLTNLNN